MAAILITGANQGIGYHLTVALLRQGHQVAVLDWETHHLAALQNTFPTQLAYYPVDVRQGEALQAAVAAAQAWQGTPEVVIHNACCCPFGGVEDLDLGQVQAAFATNYCGALQRELVTLGGVCREPQEIPLAPQGRADPLALLAWAGTLLLLGAPPERLQGP